jgi:hypothetical protein
MVLWCAAAGGRCARRHRSKDQARAIDATLDPVALLREMRPIQQQLVGIAD